MSGERTVRSGKPAPDERRGPTLNWLAVAGLALSGAFVVLAIAAPWIAPHDPTRLFEPMLSPSRLHPLGADDVGHDLLSELLYGARFSLGISLTSSLLSTLIGAALGLAAGYHRRTGALIMRVVDVFLAIPRFPLIVLMAAFLRPGPATLLLFFLLFGWPRTTRVVRSQVMAERGKGYIEAARLIGASDLRILTRHLLPATAPIALPRFLSEFQHVIVAESGLSFLGLGSPLVKSWGMMLAYASRHPTILITDLWVRWVLPPGLCITAMVLALAMIGVSTEMWYNPKLRASGRRIGERRVVRAGSEVARDRPVGPRAPAGGEYDLRGSVHSDAARPRSAAHAAAGDGALRAARD